LAVIVTAALPARLLWSAGINQPYKETMAAPVSTSLKKWLPEKIRHAAIPAANA
jgi:hypothetical protein